jgi:hypothetical protein
MVQEQQNRITGEDRCDDLSYTGVMVSTGTEYSDYSPSLYSQPENSDITVEIKNIVKLENVVTSVPNFYIVYLEMDKWVDTQKDPSPSMMWMGKSIFQLFKNMREWSFMVEEPFNSDHPMATYSKLVFDTLNPPQSILEEIDGWPDMHLAMFLKGNENYKLIPYPYPEPSQDFKNWVVELQDLYSPKSFEDLLNEI